MQIVAEAPQIAFDLIPAKSRFRSNSGNFGPRRFSEAPKKQAIQSGNRV